MTDNKNISDLLKKATPDQMMAMEALKSANSTIVMLINQLKTAEARWREVFIVAATILNKFDKEIRLTSDDMVALSPEDYQITVEAEDKTGDRIVRLRHITFKGEA